MANKVKFGLKNVHYALATFDDAGNASYATPVAIPGAVSVSFKASGDTNTFHADNIAYYVSTTNSGYEGDLEIALVPESFKIDILGEALDSKGVLFENSSVHTHQFALMFEFEGDASATRYVFYNCTATRPQLESKTNEDKTEVQTDKLSLVAAALTNGIVKAQSVPDTDSEVYEGWYTKVYMVTPKPPTTPSGE